MQLLRGPLNGRNAIIKVSKVNRGGGFNLEVPWNCLFESEKKIFDVKFHIN